MKFPLEIQCSWSLEEDESYDPDESAAIAAHDNAVEIDDGDKNSLSVRDQYLSNLEDSSAVKLCYSKYYT